MSAYFLNQRASWLLAGLAAFAAHADIGPAFSGITALDYADLGDGHLDQSDGLAGHVRGSFKRNHAVILDMQVVKRFKDLTPSFNFHLQLSDGSTRRK